MAASWDPSKSSGSVPQLKGARWFSYDEHKKFSYDELKKCTNNFLEDNELGSGGYGKVNHKTLLFSFFFLTLSDFLWIIFEK